MGVIIVWNYVKIMLNSKEAINAAQLQKLANQSMLNITLVTKIVNNAFSETNKNIVIWLNKKRCKKENGDAANW